jgi:hypothetical protein
MVLLSDRRIIAYAFYIGCKLARLDRASLAIACLIINPRYAIAYAFYIGCKLARLDKTIWAIGHGINF